MATSSQYRQLLSDYGPPSLGYTQEEKRARARERDRLKKRRRREDGLKRSLERQRNALAMRRWREQRREECGATRRRRQDAEDLDQEKRKDLETRQQRQQRRRGEQARASRREGQCSIYRAKLARASEPFKPCGGLGGWMRVPVQCEGSLAGGERTLFLLRSPLLDWIPLPDWVPLLDGVRRMIPAPASSLPGIIHARGLVRECLAETERNARS
ncbi:PREDICTED: cyclin-dependent kinase 2-associated protein 1 [Myotis davidii]|uniref:cyclin-dependent kinase 2-associated protein 1 n=1 Tax=Myotis davidii TaxID=225400 RepID=UPI000767C648|nr:PREDICTED: cyclin-dependent kinase 2-associated protein 1 [Myotis davidii]